jgi:rare lipoprotein A (peptidoglycan hydrolase)
MAAELMGSGIDRVLVAKVGAVAFAWALTAPVVLTGATTRTEAVGVASVMTDELVPLVHMAVTPATTSVLTGVSSSIADIADVPQLPVRTAVLAHSSGVVDAAPRRGSLASRWAAVPGPEAYVTDGVVLASWYGPGFYGRRTACGQTYSPEIVGVAHRVLRCGTLIQLTSPAGITLTVPVIDRGPYITGRALDLSNATKIGLACRDLCRVRMLVLQ